MRGALSAGARGTARGRCALALCRLLTLVLLDVRNRVADGADLLGVLVGNVDLELLFEREHQLHDGERVGAQVVDERSGLFHFRQVDIQLLRDDLFDLLGDIHPFLRKHANREAAKNLGRRCFVESPRRLATRTCRR